MEMSRDAGSIPAASTLKPLMTKVVSGLFYWTYDQGNVAIDPQKGVLDCQFRLVSGLFSSSFIQNLARTRGLRRQENSAAERPVREVRKGRWPLCDHRPFLVSPGTFPH